MIELLVSGSPSAGSNSHCDFSTPPEIPSRYHQETKGSWIHCSKRRQNLPYWAPESKKMRFHTDHVTASTFVSCGPKSKVFVNIFKDKRWNAKIAAKSYSMWWAKCKPRSPKNAVLYEDNDRSNKSKVARAKKDSFKRLTNVFLPVKSPDASGCDSGIFPCMKAKLKSSYAKVKGRRTRKWVEKHVTTLLKESGPAVRTFALDFRPRLRAVIRAKGYHVGAN
jgi:hypothetical protein